MISFLRYLSLLREGGWSNAITQNTIITPQLIGKILIEIKKVTVNPQYRAFVCMPKSICFE